MEKITLKKRKITKIGDSYGFIIDMAYVKNDHILKDDLYDLTIVPSSKDQGGGPQ